MKKTVSVMALAASTSAFGIFFPNVETKTACLRVYDSGEGQYVDTCDSAANNKELGLELGENGCAEGQAAMTQTKGTDGVFRPEIAPCLPPNIAQL